MSDAAKNLPPSRPAAPPPRFADPELERAFRELRERLTTLEASPAGRILADQQLEDGVETPIAHGLGRPPSFVRTSVVRDATATGRIVEVRSADYDRAQYVVLKATGHGATITVDIEVK